MAASSPTTAGRWKLDYAPDLRVRIAAVEHFKARRTPGLTLFKRMSEFSDATMGEQRHIASANACLREHALTDDGDDAPHAGEGANRSRWDVARPEAVDGFTLPDGVVRPRSLHIGPEDDDENSREPQQHRGDEKELPAAEPK